MTLPPEQQPSASLPPDREEIVEEVVAPGEVQQRRVVRSEGLERRATISRVNQVIWLMFGLVPGLIAIRVLLKLIGANPAAVFAQIIYGVTDVFLWPFAGLVGTPAVGAIQLEVSSIIAMLVYALAAWLITRLIWVLFDRPATQSETTLHRRRY